MGGTGPGQARDDYRGQQINVPNLGVARQQVAEQQPIFQELQYLPVERDDPSSGQAVDLA